MHSVREEGVVVSLERKRRRKGKERKRKGKERKRKEKERRRKGKERVKSEKLLKRKRFH